MLESLVERVLLRRPASRGARVFWALFLLLGPLAYVGGSMLEQHGMSRTTTVIPIDREGALATGQQFAAAHKLDVGNWSRYASIDPSKDLLEYFRLHREAAATAVQSFVSPVTLRVLLVSGKQMAEVTLSRAGHPIGYDFTRVAAATAGDSRNGDAQLAIARASLERIPNLASTLSLGRPEVKALERAGKGCSTFTWEAKAAALTGLSFEAVSAVCGTSVVRETITASVDDDYAAAHWGRAALPLKILVGIYALYITIVVIFAIYRYARRSVEHEVSHKRTVGLAAAIGAAMSANFLSGIDEYVFGLVKAGSGVMWYPLIVVMLSFLVGGLGLAMAYGAGEGDLREFYPGKMTSLDAIMRGKLFSRNVARSALFGVIFAAWMLVLEGAADWLLRPDSVGFLSEHMKLPFLRSPLVSIFAGQISMVTLIPASGLLLPMAFLGRKVRRPRLRGGLTVLFAVLASLFGVMRFGNVGTALVSVAALTAILLGPFFAMDFLSVIFAVGAFEIATSLARLIVLSPAWLQLGVSVGAIGVAFLAVETWAALRGREYREEEVRPLYAGHMLERQSMQAELAAAREAQLHLLPKSTPEVNGLSISAACVPARIVGGDFYDFYELGDGRLGIFIAEGGNRGIGSAMHIALAKGFLMHAVRRNLAPREIVLRLQKTIGPLLEGSGAATHVAYAVIDPAAGALRYARTGDYPRVVAGSGLSSEQRVESADSGTPLYEGSADLSDGDTVLLFTDGIARRVRTSGPKAAEGILKALARKRRPHELEDDLTAVVVRVTQVGGAAMEVVA